MLATLDCVLGFLFSRSLKVSPKTLHSGVSANESRCPVTNLGRERSLTIGLLFPGHAGLRSTASLSQSDKLWVSIIFRITLHPSLTCLAPFIWVQVGGQYGDLDLLMGTSTRWQTSMPSAYFILVSMSTKSGQSVPISRIAASLSDVEPTTYNPWTDSRRRARMFRAGPCSSIRKIQILKSTSRLTGESHATAKWMGR